MVEVKRLRDSSGWPSLHGNLRRARESQELKIYLVQNLTLNLPSLLRFRETTAQQPHTSQPKIRLISRAYLILSEDNSFGQSSKNPLLPHPRSPLHPPRGRRLKDQCVQSHRHQAAIGHGRVHSSVGPSSFRVKVSNPQTSGRNLEEGHVSSVQTIRRGRALTLTGESGPENDYSTRRGQAANSQCRSYEVQMD